MSNPPKRQKVQIAEHARKIWLITYGASCQDITPDILDRCRLEVDECYTIQWRESKYTLIHLRAKQRGSTISKRISSTQPQFGIIASNILGYESITGNVSQSTDDHQKIDDHPGFQRMVEILNTDPSQIKSWTRTDSPFTNTKGVFWQYLETLPSDQASKTQLKRIIDKWKPMIQELKTIKPAYESVMRRLADREARLDDVTSALQKEQEFRELASMQLSEKRRECAELEKEIIRLTGRRPNIAPHPTNME